MRIIFAAALALSPSLLLAQTNTPATNGNQSNQKTLLQSKLVAPGTIGSAANTDRSATAPPVRISTGVVPPVLLSTTPVESDGNWHLRVAAPSLTVEVEMVVDATGTPIDVKLVHSAGAFADRGILASVAHYRFKPGTLDGQPTAVPVKLDIMLERGAQY